MIIQNSSIAMTSNRDAVARYSKNESLKTWIGARPTNEAMTSIQINEDSSIFSDQAKQLAQGLKNGQSDSEGLTVTQYALNLRQSALDAQKEQQRHASPSSITVPTSTQTTSSTASANSNLSSVDSLKLRILIAILEKMYGIKVDADSLIAAQQALAQTSAISGTNATGASEGASNPGYGVEYEYHEQSIEAEKTNFTANGIIQTADGREIQFEANLSMSRAYMSNTDISLRLGNAVKDPLMITFDGNAVALTEDKYSFDIDADGVFDQISFIKNGAILALDKNNDGMINDGQEVFGALTGDGFSELAAYDEDGNGWIDEADSVFSQLKLWTKDASGNDKLIGIAETGIGAIYLGKVATEFSLKTALENTSLGQVRSTGVFLYESGQTGVIQQVDLVV